MLALHAGLDAVLRLQDGIIRRDQAMAAGLSGSTVASKVYRRHWVRVLPRVYAVDVDPASPTARVRAAALWAGDDAVIAGPAAAWLWQLTDRPAPLIHVVVPPHRRMSQVEGVDVLRSALADEEIGVHRRIRVTTPVATCLQLARLSEPDLLEVALRNGLTAQALDDELERGRGRRGQVRARQSRQAVSDNPWSCPERALHELFRRAGLTGWTANPKVPLPVGVRYPDVLFEDIKLIVEVDGRRHHSSPAQHDYDHRRQNAFVVERFTVLRFTPDQIEREPDAVISQVRQMVELLRRDAWSAEPE